MKKVSLSRIQKQKLWKKHLQGWESSNLTQAEYCKQHNLKIKHFWYWKRKTNKKESPSARFHQLQVDLTSKFASESSKSTLLLKIDQHHEIAIGDDFKPKVLARLINTLRSL